MLTPRMKTLKSRGGGGVVAGGDVGSVRWNRECYYVRKHINVSIYTLIYCRLHFEFTSTLIITVTTSELNFFFYSSLHAPRLFWE